MEPKHKLLYDTTAHIDEKLIDDVINNGFKDRNTKSNTIAKKQAYEKRVVVIIASILAFIMIFGTVFVSLNMGTTPILYYLSSENITSILETKVTINPFIGEYGNYSGAKFMSIADTTKTAMSVYKNKEYNVALKSYSQKSVWLSDMFDNLSEKLLNGNDNAVISPVNVYFALSLLAECTSGQSQKQILDFIGVSNIEELREQTKLIWLYNSKDDKFGKSMISNSIWLSGDMPVNESCVDILNNNYYASAFAGDFSSVEYKNALKQWLSDQTNNLLDDCINELEIPDDISLVLASTLYYKARWNLEYVQTENGFFKGIKGNQNCIFNKKTLNSTIYETEDYCAFFDNLSDGNKICFFLPNDGLSVSDILKNDLISFVNENKEETPYNVTVKMPDFDVSFNNSIVETLKEFGIKDCMDKEKADFSSLTNDNLHLDDIIHASRFKADKTGVEGASYTISTVFGGTTLDCEKYTFALDRPFIFIVVNNGIPLFIGTVTNI